LLFGLAMVNVPVPEALPDKAIFDNLVLLNRPSAHKAHRMSRLRRCK
jgi:hypothetical protein